MKLPGFQGGLSPTFSLRIRPGVSTPRLFGQRGVARRGEDHRPAAAGSNRRSPGGRSPQLDGRGRSHSQASRLDAAIRRSTGDHRDGPGVGKANYRDGRRGRLRTAVSPGSGETQDLAAKVEWAIAHLEALAQMRRAARAEFEQKYTAERNYMLLADIYQGAIEVSGRGISS